MKTRRHAKILEIINSNSVETQEELSELLTFASETLDELMELNSSLEELKRELIGTIAAIGW